MALPYFPLTGLLMRDEARSCSRACSYQRRAPSILCDELARSSSEAVHDLMRFWISNRAGTHAPLRRHGRRL